MENLENSYLKTLSLSHTLEVYSSSGLIFSSTSKWLHPLFELEDFLKSIPYSGNILSVHDSAIGKAGAVLLIRMGIKKIYGNIVSRLALQCIRSFNENVDDEYKIDIKWGTLVDRLMCATEAELASYSGSSENDLDYMYFLIRQRANKVLGVSVNVDSVSYSFVKFRNLSFSLKAGGHLMITGENGTGKTTLLRMIAGIYKPLTGSILIDNKEIAKLPKFTIGYIPQFTDNNDYSLSVSEVVGLGIKIRKLGKIKNKETKEEIIRKSLERTSSLNLLNRNFSDLSGGEKQKVSLSRCLAQNAKVLLLDEPTASLDEENRKMVIDIVRSLSVTEIPTIIIATHDKDLLSLSGWKTLNIDNESARKESL